MLFVRTQDTLFELPTAVACQGCDGNDAIAEFVDKTGAVIARLSRATVLAYSSQKEKLDMGLAEEREYQTVTSA